ncbi:MBL fold metallo-hydrolase [Streptococcus dentiloxodontae]
MSKVKKIDYFACGSCKNQASLLFKSQPRKTIIFPAGVFLIHHENLGYILYDTGYSYDVMKPTPRNIAYRLPNPIRMTAQDTIDAQLQQIGIPAYAIKTVLVSHLHPDHIGRLKAFQQATFYLTADCYKTYQKSSMRDLVFRDYFPDDFDKRLVILKMTQKSEVLEEQACYDFAEDGSMILYSLDGHARGQMGLHMPEKNIFLAADVLWGIEFLDKAQDMKRIPKLIQQDFQAYLASAKLMKNLIEKGVRVLFSHDRQERIREVLHE